MTTTRSTTAAGLRRWAKGVYASEAAVELLIRFNHGRLLHGPWIEHDDQHGRYWFSADMVPVDGGVLSGGERRVLEIAASLADPYAARIGLGDLLPGLDREALALVLSAVAHAGGSHEHSEVHFDEHGTYTGSHRLAPLYAWPEETDR